MLTKLRGLIKSLVYRIYEGRLVAKVAAGPMPRHVGIILDGNRRHGRANGLMDPERIYRLGASKLDEILAWSTELKIPMLTLWVFSPDNLSRPEAEIGGILGALEAKMQELAADPFISQPWRAGGCDRQTGHPAAGTAGFDRRGGGRNQGK